MGRKDIDVFLFEQRTGVEPRRRGCLNVGLFVCINSPQLELRDLKPERR